MEINPLCDKAQEKRIIAVLPSEESKVRRNNLILQFIKDNAPISPYSISKQMKIPYSTVVQSVRELEHCGLILIRMSINQSNHALKLCYMPEEQPK